MENILDCSIAISQRVWLNIIWSKFTSRMQNLLEEIGRWHPQSENESSCFQIAIVIFSPSLLGMDVFCICKSSFYYPRNGKNAVSKSHIKCFISFGMFSCVKREWKGRDQISVRRFGAAIYCTCIIYPDIFSRNVIYFPIFYSYSYTCAAFLCWSNEFVQHIGNFLGTAREFSAHK